MNIINITDDKDNMTLSNYTNKDEFGDIMTIELSYLFLIILTLPCFLSIVCCLAFSICGFIKIIKKYKT